MQSTSVQPMSAHRPFLVTRPAAAGHALTQALRARGVDAHWLPAFEIGPPPDPALAQSTLVHLARFDLALFVSPAAVRATAALLGERAWPAATAIGAVGAGTRDAARAALRFDATALPQFIAPDEEASEESTPESAPAEGASGSEAYWQVQRAHDAACGHAPQRVLILRAEQGRDWLQTRFEQAGAEVTRLAVYARVARPWTADDARWIAQRVAGVPPGLVVTSSEAVDSLCAAAAAADASGATLRWLQRGRALALHPRIAARLQAAGFTDAACVPCEVEALLRAA
jgi:uroporphyrinogen-III synthase